MYECFWSIMHKFQISNIQGLEDLQRLSALLHRESEGAVRSRGDQAQPAGETVSTSKKCLNVFVNTCSNFRQQRTSVNMPNIEQMLAAEILRSVETVRFNHFRENIVL